MSLLDILEDNIDGHRLTGPYMPQYNMDWVEGRDKYNTYMGSHKCLGPRWQ